MDAVSYPDNAVAQFITEKVIPLRVPANAQPLSSDFKVQWTPTLVILDENGEEHNRTVGYLPPEELLASLLLGISKVAFDNGKYDDAVVQLNTLGMLYPKSGAAPEALYLKGVAKFKATHDAQLLKQTYEQLSSQYPDSEWTRRALPYRLL
ncbi:thioredoxin fold domain-containing protein [Geomonas sp. RF6]|uniref:thioredoxin fold domain-containing protein n=1 Tax=Geomonas sp. RF6 TaxID=2897342 RepID=UPI001E5131C0|nr:thioredoxin fold domain-containing protein [Geomonas sp. RF6]UFS71807.1 thioredoxin fold domain-containing protein [Geomonas sp. RF6]